MSRGHVKTSEDGGRCKKKYCHRKDKRTVLSMSCYLADFQIVGGYTEMGGNAGEGKLTLGRKKESERRQANGENLMP